MRRSRLTNVGRARRLSTASVPVLATMAVKGDTAELLAAYDSYEAALDERGGPAPGLLLHVCAATHDGIVVLDVWESELALRAWLARTPGQPEPRVLPVHGLRARDALPSLRPAGGWQVDETSR